MGEITIKHLAETLNVSTATVSKALNDSHEISDATKERVAKMAKLLNYRPNPFASGLRKQKSNTIAVILPEIANNFFAQAINGIEEVARQKGYHLLIYLSHDSSEREAFFIKDILSRCVDGLLISASFDDIDFSHLDKIQEKLPTVFFDRTYHGSGLSVTNNDFESAYEATKHLHECGCKRIAYLSSLQNLETGNQRFEGYLSAIKAFDMPFSDDLVLNDSRDKDENIIRMQNLVKNIKPDGVVSAIEKMAKLCYHTCNNFGVVIPDDIKIISFSNLDCAALLNPPLTTITQQAFQMGREAAMMLFKTLKNNNYIAESKVINAELIPRKSTQVLVF